MNQVIISGLIKGNDFQEVSNDGLLMQVATRIGRGNNADPDVFNVLAYGKAAEFVRQHAESGQRIVAEGRLSSEKLGTNNYHTVITLHRVLSIGDSRTGMDFTQAAVTGTVRADELKTTGKGTTLAPFNVKNVRHYRTRDGNEGEYTTYFNATAWGDKATSLQEAGHVPCNDEYAVLNGILKPSSYEKEGETVNKIEIWIDDINFSGAQASSGNAQEANTETADSTPPPSSSYKSAEAAPF